MRPDTGAPADAANVSQAAAKLTQGRSSSAGAVCSWALPWQATSSASSIAQGAADTHGKQRMACMARS